MSKRPLILALAAFALAPFAHAAVSLAPLFADGAVLQREKPVPVWGAANAGEKISVSFAGQTLTTAADANGLWRVTLAALPADATPRELIVRGTNTLTIRDVLVGEVWLASGQSNMEWPVSHSADPKAVIAAAKFPLVRHFKVEHKSATTPLTTATGAWLAATPENAGKFSAVAWHFSALVHERLHVPVGIINCSWGGTALEAWMDEPTYLADPGRARRLADARKKIEPQPDGPGNHTTLAGAYNGMIHPMVPYALRGVIWYQGEGNVRRADIYSDSFAALITGWRRAFGQGDFPFYWVQLPNFDLGGQNQTNWQWAELREAQTKTLALPNTGQAVTLDVGEPKGLHPPRKKPVGDRLALLALARTYAVEHMVDAGPVFKSATREGRSYRIAYAPSPAALKSAAASLTGFELAGADQVFHDAEARIDGATVVVSSPAVADPVAVRYAYRNSPVAGLFNTEGLPAAPFRTDTWPAPKAAKAPPPTPES